MIAALVQVVNNTTADCSLDCCIDYSSNSEVV